MLTHWHHDHVGGINELRQVCAEAQELEEREGEGKAHQEAVKTYKYPLFDLPSSSTLQDPQSADQQSRKRETQLLRSANDDHDVGPIHDLHDGQILEVGNPKSPDSEKLKLQVLYTPGHTFDHIALLITSSSADPSEVGTIFTGDAVLGHGTAVFENLALYMNSLQKMKEAIGKITAGESSGEDGDDCQAKEGMFKAFPAHGAVISDAKSKIEEYITHRAMREREVLNVLVGGSPSDQDQDGGLNGEGKPLTPMEIVKVVYKDVPEFLHIAAQGGVVQVLAKLEAEGRVEKLKDGKEWRIAEKSSQQGTTIDDGQVEEPKSAL